MEDCRLQFQIGGLGQSSWQGEVWTTFKRGVEILGRVFQAEESTNRMSLRQDYAWHLSRKPRHQWSRTEYIRRWGHKKYENLIVKGLKGPLKSFGLYFQESEGSLERRLEVEDEEKPFYISKESLWLLCKSKETRENTTVIFQERNDVDWIGSWARGDKIRF